MQTTRLTSNAGQLNGCTIFGANASISTETAIFTISHNMKLTALAPGDTLLSRLAKFFGEPNPQSRRTRPCT